MIGVADKVKGPPALSGTAVDIAVLRKRVWDLTDPRLIVEAKEFTVLGRRIVIVRVPQSPDVHADTQGRAKRRIGRDCVPMKPIEIARLRDERAGYDWSSQETRLTSSSIAPIAIDVVRRRLSASATPELRAHAKASTPDLLRALGVVDAKGRLLEAGRVLLCPNTAPAVVYQYRNTPGGETKAVERLHYPLISAFERLLELIAARRNATNVTLPDGQQIVIDDFPVLAVRETIANAVLHRDYTINSPVTVEHSPELMVVSSPGPLVAGVTPSNILTHPSAPRNPCLVAAARLVGMAEETGRGVDRIFREMIRVGKKLPQIESPEDYVRVTLSGGAPNTQVAKFVAQLPQDEREDTDTLLVLFSLCNKKSITASELSSVLQKSVDEADQVLRRLAAEPPGVVEPTRSTARLRLRTYRLRDHVLRALGNAVPYNRRTTDDIDRKVIAHVREYGVITNKTVQNLLDVSLIKARDLLKDLVARKILIKDSPNERGPGVMYSPGTAFPSRPRKQNKK